MQYLKVKNWEQFQHFKDRRPPWIKLYKDLLDDYLFHSLPVESRALAPMLWLMASEHEPLGAIKYDIKMISFRLRMTEQEVDYALKPLIESHLFTLDINTISKQYPNDTPETETYSKEKEIKKERELLSIFKNKILNEEMKKFAEDKGIFGAHLEKSWQRFLIKKGNTMIENKCSYEQFYADWQLWILDERIEESSDKEEVSLTGEDLKIQNLGIAAWKRRMKMNLDPGLQRLLDEHEATKGYVWWESFKQFKEGKSS